MFLFLLWTDNSNIATIFYCSLEQTISLNVSSRLQTARNTCIWIQKLEQLNIFAFKNIKYFRHNGLHIGAIFCVQTGRKKSLLYFICLYWNIYKKYCKGLEGLKEWIFIFLSNAGSYHVHYMWDNSTCCAEIHFSFLFMNSKLWFQRTI